MRKVFLVVASVFALGVANAQTGNNAIGIGAEINLPMGDFGDAFKTGFGGSLKYLHGVGSAGQVTLTTGYSVFKMKDGDDDFDVTSSIIPILAGYRHNFSGLYVEPQVGYGIYGAKVKMLGEEESDSEGAFTWAIGAGYAMQQGLDLGVRYQSASKDGSSTSFIGFRVGYNFSLGGASASK
ncbi:MAG TPA: outer membrane beta-barrel protein [Flavisolibacter sp.]|nr:outer membrane beta-barrel protein [Flavisolibacter sp.]